MEKTGTNDSFEANTGTMDVMLEKKKKEICESMLIEGMAVRNGHDVESQKQRYGLSRIIKCCQSRC